MPFSLRPWSVLLSALIGLAIGGESLLAENLTIGRPNGPMAARRRPVRYEYRSHEDYVRWARYGAPTRLNEGQLDSTSGLLAWPRVLLRNEYAAQRRALDRLFAERANVLGAIDNDRYDDILANIEQMTRQLKSSIRFLKTKDYIDARKFLRGLEYETVSPLAASDAELGDDE